MCCRSPRRHSAAPRLASRQIDCRQHGSQPRRRLTGVHPLSICTRSHTRPSAAVGRVGHSTCRQGRRDSGIECSCASRGSRRRTALSPGCARRGGDWRSSERSRARSSARRPSPHRASSRPAGARLKEFLSLVWARILYSCMEFLRFLEPVCDVITRHAEKRNSPRFFGRAVARQATTTRT